MRPRLAAGNLWRRGLLKLPVDRHQRVHERAMGPHLARGSLHWLEAIGIKSDDHDSILQFRLRWLLEKIGERDVFQIILRRILNTNFTVIIQLNRLAVKSNSST